MSLNPSGIAIRRDRCTEVFLQFKALLVPFGLTRYCTIHWGAYTRHLDSDVHSPGTVSELRQIIQDLDLEDCLRIEQV